MAGVDDGAGSGVRPGWRWDVALSFASAQRDYVEQVAEALKARGVRCFYDADEEIELWGRYLAEELPAIYGARAATVVVFVSAEYVARDWTRLERRAALAQALRERREYVLPARFDDTPVPGLLSDMIAVNLHGRTPQQFAGMIADKLAALAIGAPTPHADVGDPAGSARPVPAVSASPWLLMDSAYFDLTEIRFLIQEAMNASPSQVIGFSVTDPEETFVKKLRHWLQGYAMGETELKDRLNLSPLAGRPDKWLEQVRAYRKDLDEVNVLLEVVVERTLSDESITTFWTEVCQDFADASRRLVLLFIGARDGYPSGITVLPPPQFKRHDVARWTGDVVHLRGWSLDLAAIWTAWLCERAAFDGQLDARMLYVAMEKSVDHFRMLSPEEFRVKLESRMI